MILSNPKEKESISPNIPASWIAWQMMSLGAANNLFAVLNLREWTIQNQEKQLAALLQSLTTKEGKA